MLRTAKGAYNPLRQSPFAGRVVIMQMATDGAGEKLNLDEKRAGKLDYYSILDTKPGAEPDEIKEAYRELAKKYHPDVSVGDEAQKEV